MTNAMFLMQSGIPFRNLSAIMLTVRAYNVCLKSEDKEDKCDPAVVSRVPIAASSPTKAILEWLDMPYNGEISTISTINTDSNIEPDYYQSAYGGEPIDLIEFYYSMRGPEATMSALDFNVMKYIVRYASKNGIEDLKKARTYLDRLIGILEKK